MDPLIEVTYVHVHCVYRIVTLLDFMPDIPPGWLTRQLEGPGNIPASHASYYVLSLEGRVRPCLAVRGERCIDEATGP